MVLNNLITEEIYNIKKAEIEKEMKSTIVEIQLHEQADNNFKECLITAFYLASKSYDLFICSKNCEKREIINFVFSNIQLEGQKLGYSLRKPFDMMVNLSYCADWLPTIDKFRTFAVEISQNMNGVLPFEKERFCA